MLLLDKFKCQQSVDDLLHEEIEIMYHLKTHITLDIFHMNIKLFLNKINILNLKNKHKLLTKNLKFSSISKIKAFKSSSLLQSNSLTKTSLKSLIQSSSFSINSNNPNNLVPKEAQDDPKVLSKTAGKFV